MRLLEEEKQNMGAAGKKRENELLAEIANLRRELAERAARIDELKAQGEKMERTLSEREAQIEELKAVIRGLEAKIADLER
jgi:uncharacterized coiled-coil DUF342 family protein